ncbi:MAG: hypothetical protein II393_01915 [Cytophagales bacterium]|nr:hypothetical protein [Cytophagales bacterium]
MRIVLYISFVLFFFFPPVHYFSSDIDSVFSNDRNIGLYKYLYQQFVNIDIGVISSVVTQKDKDELNIFLPTKEDISVLGSLPCGGLLSEKICLVALLGNPVCDLDVLLSRQALLQRLFSTDLSSIGRLLFSFSTYEQLFFSLLLRKQDFSLITDETIIEMLDTVLLFLEITDSFISLMPSLINSQVSSFFRGISYFVALYHNNKQFKQLVDSFKTKNKTSQFCFRRYSKIKKLRKFFYFSDVFLRVFVDIITVMVYNNLRQIRDSFCFVSFFPRHASSDPYVDVVVMKNFYSNSKVDHSFSLTLKKVGSKTLMDINGVFAYDSTAKNLLMNIYLAQVFGIAFAKKFSISIFNKIYTSNLHR